MKKEFIYKKFPKFCIILFFIFLLGFCFRFYNSPNRYYFDPDGIRDAIIAREGAKELSFSLVGPFSSTGPFTFGPWYWNSLIVTSILYANPYSPWILMGLLSLISIVVMYDIGRLLDSKEFGLILAGITSIVPSQISVATGLSNINPVSFFAILSIWISIKVLTRQKDLFLWLIMLGVSLGLGINAHYQMTGLLLLPVFIWLSIGWKKYNVIPLVLIGIFFTFIPLLIFNLQTHWQTIRGIEAMYQSRGRIYVPNSWRIYLFQFLPSIISYTLGIPAVVGVFFFGLFLISFFKNLIRSSVPPAMVILFGIFLVNIVSLRFYWGERNFVYLYYLTPILLIFIGYFLLQLLRLRYGKVIFSIVVIIIGTYILVGNYTTAKAQPQAVFNQEMQSLVTTYPQKRFIFYSCNRANNTNAQGLAYLFSFTDQSKSSIPIGVLGSNCHYPSIAQYDFSISTTSAKFANQKYPLLHKFALVDFSIASPSAIKEASWSAISTKSIFDKSVRWWK